MTEVSEALPAEYARLSELTVAAYRAVGPMPDGYAAELADVAGRAADPGAVVLAARRDGRVVGGVTLVPQVVSFAKPHCVCRRWITGVFAIC